jgi:hypothetical protein
MMHQQVDTEEAEARVEWWQQNAIEWAEMCKEAWRVRDMLRERNEWLEQELIKERGYL